MATLGAGQSRRWPLVTLLAASALAAHHGTLKAATPPRDAATDRLSAARDYGALPLRFEPNVGQADARFGFLSRGGGHAVFLAPDETVLSVRGGDKRLRLRLVGGRKPQRIAGEEVMPGRSNYYLGDDPRRWRTGVPAYARVRYERVYPGIDLVYYGNDRQLEYDFVVAPGADPSAIVLSIDGADRRSISADGDLVLRMGGIELRQRRPLLYQEVDGKRIPVAGGYVLKGGSKVAFRVGAYDHTRPLVIDPVITLAYSSYFGGSSHENTIYSGIAVDAEGAAYIVGNTHSSDLPGAGPKPGGTKSSIFLAKLSPAGDAVVYSTYLGGNVDLEGHDIAIDPAGNAYVVGFTHGTGLPVLNAFQPTFGGGIGDAVVAKFNPDGTLAYSTYLGGRGAGIDRSYERAHAVGVDADGHAYVTGMTSSSVNFPIVGGVQSTLKNSIDAFVTKFAPDGRSLLFSTFVGGTRNDFGYNIAIDEQRAVYVAGNTLSFDDPATAAYEGFPVANALQPTFGGGSSDAFVFKLNPEGNQLVFSTYLGGTSSESDDSTLVAPTGGVALDTQGNVYVAGHTRSPNFPTTSNRLQAFTGSQDLFVTKLTPEGDRILYSTFLGATSVIDVCLGLAVDGRGSAYVTGYSHTGFPRINALPLDGSTNFGSNNDAIVAKLTPDGSALLYSTYLGGRMRDQAHDIALDASGHAYITGVTYSASFPLAGAVDPICTGCQDAFFEGISEAFVAKIFLTNQAPSALPDSFETDEDVPLVAAAPGLLANDSDVNPQDTVSATLASSPARGTVTLRADGSFTYVPDADFSGTDTFTYTAGDGLLQGVPATVSIAVRATNDPPVANAGGPYSVDEGGALTLQGSGMDGEGDALTFDWDLDGDGTFETPGQTATFVAGNGPATATVFLRVTDAPGTMGMASAAVTVRNLIPVASADAFTTTEDAELTVAAPGLLGNDQDFDPLTATLVAGPQRGALTLEADGSFRYVPAPNANGSDSFSYRASDGVDASEIVTVAIAITPVNDPPTADAGGPYAVNEGEAVTLAGSGTDVENGALSFAWDLDGDGTFETAGPSPTLAAGDGPATRTVSLRVSDPEGASAVAAAIITVANMAPVAAPDTLTTTQGVAVDVAAPGLLGNDRDFDPLSAVLVSAPASGTLTLNADGSLRYVPSPGVSGTDSFTYQASDGLATSDLTTVTITIAPSDEGPDAVDDTFAFAKRRYRQHVLDVLANDGAGDGGTLTIVAVTQPAHGKSTIAADGRTVLYRAARRFVGHEFFTYTVRNAGGATDTATVVVTIAPRGRGRGGQGHHDDDDDDDEQED